MVYPDKVARATGATAPLIARWRKALQSPVRTDTASTYAAGCAGQRTNVTEAPSVATDVRRPAKRTSAAGAPQPAKEMFMILII